MATLVLLTYLGDFCVRNLLNFTARGLNLNIRSRSLNSETAYPKVSLDYGKHSPYLFCHKLSYLKLFPPFKNLRFIVNVI